MWRISSGSGDLSRRKFLSLSAMGATAGILLPTVLDSCNNVMEKYEPTSGLEMNASDLVNLMVNFTETYKNFSADNIESREAACMNILWKGMVQKIKPADLFAGRIKQLPIGFSPQSDEGALGYYVSTHAVNKLLQAESLSAENIVKLRELITFWEKENTVAKTKLNYPKGMMEILPSDNYTGESGIAFTLWRMSGIQLDYRKLVMIGIPGLIAEIKDKQKLFKKNNREYQLYEAMLQSLETFVDVCHYYAVEVKKMAAESHDPQVLAELELMNKVLNKIAIEKPGSFREGLQLLFLYNAIDGARNYGRLDDSLGELYAADITAGRIDEEEAVRLLGSIWKLMSDRHYRYDTRIIIGGKGRINEKASDQLALAILETTRRVKDIVPQLALRFYEGQNPQLYHTALNIIATGNPYPMLYNDDVNIPAVMKAFALPYEEAIHAIQFGCGEYVLDHRSVGTPSAVINLLQALLVTLHMGIDPKSGKRMGMPVERYDKYNHFLTFEDLLSAYKEQVEYHVEQLALHEKLEYDFAGRDNPYLFSSILMDDCIARGKSMFNGGIRYLGGTLESYGNSNCSDSLVAIKKLVYEQKIFTLAKLREMLHVDFAGFEKEQRMMLSCPKYGNDNPDADSMLQNIHNHLCNFTRDQKNVTGLHSYLIVIINNDANTVIGMQTTASPDGRKAYTYMNPGNNPVGGADKNGVTAFLNSLLKPDPTIHAGAVQNMKFSKELFTKNRSMLEALLYTYFKQGGTQAMLTVISRGDLEDAMRHPENYQNLIVRVGGFSERFVNLPPETQQEILSRTLY